MRVAEDLNAGLHAVLASGEDVYLLGEDVSDPYGGAFKITRGLSSSFPGRVLSTPLSEGAIVGAAGGLALAGDRAIAEIMFGDFATLGFDQIVNFASKSVSMYGRPVPIRLILRCPVGGNRGYGPTHSQSLQKHFIGVPNLALFELSPFHASHDLLNSMFDSGRPSVLFEDKVLYTQQMFRGGRIDDLFGYDFIDADQLVARVGAAEAGAADNLLIAPGGLAYRVLGAMRSLFLEEETVCELLVPARLYPFDVTCLAPSLAAARRVFIVEDSVAGGTWGSEVAQSICAKYWNLLREPIRLVHSADSIIPTAPHLERAVLVQESTVRQALKEPV